VQPPRGSAGHGWAKQQLLGLLLVLVLPVSRWDPRDRLLGGVIIQGMGCLGMLLNVLCRELTKAGLGWHLLVRTTG